MASTTTTTSLISSINPANGSTVVTSMPSSTASIHAAVLQHFQTTSPKQFIPVGVLTGFLILLFFSHLMRYPRILYVSQEHLGHRARSIQENHYPNQQSRTFYEKERDTRASFFPRTSFSGSKRLSSFDPHTEAIYSEPTVRLVRTYHNRSPEPRVYLPEEITVPSPSQTLVNSSRSDVSISNMDIQTVPPRVYLPPLHPEIFELSLTHQQGDIFYTNSDSLPTSNLLWTPPSNQSPSGLSTFPLTRSLTGFGDLITTSSGVLTLPFIQDQLHTSIPTTNPIVETFEPGPQGSCLTCSPELGPPPLAHAQPILVKRALSPWRRRSPLEPSYDTFQTDTEINGVFPHRHRPSVPSRLRYFITRSVTTSLSGSQIQSTPASSSGKRSEKSLTWSRPSSNHDATVLLRSRRAEETGTRFSEDLLSASARMSELAITSEIPWQNASFGNKSPAQANHLQQRELLHDFRQLPIPGVEWRDSQASSADAEEDVAQDLHKEESSSLPPPDMHRTSLDCCSSVGLGLCLVSEPISTQLHAHGNLAPSGDEDPQYLQANGSLRTVPSRWMSLSPAFSDAHTLLAKETGLNRILSDMVADESVEIMIMGRSEGLDGV